MTFGEKLYQLRTGKKMSQEALARKLGVSRQAISRWELGEVIPDTANVLAVSRLFGVSTDYLLRENCGDEDTPSPGFSAQEEGLKERQYAVGKAMFCRFGALAGPAVWHLHSDEADGLLLAFTLGITLLFGILLARSTAQVRKRSWDAAGKLLINDVFSVCSICFLPQLLHGIPGNWEIFLAQLTMVPFLQKNWLLLRRVYDLPDQPPKKKR